MVTEGKAILQTDVSYGIPGNWIGRSPENGGNATEPVFNIAPCLTKTDQHAVVGFHPNAQADQLPTSKRDTSISDTLTTSQQAAVATTTQVRRRHPLSMRGYKDSWTIIPIYETIKGQTQQIALDIEH